MDYHTEPFTRGILMKIPKYFPGYKSISMSTKDMETYSRKSATPEQRTEYFEHAENTFQIIGHILRLVMVFSFLLHMFLFKTALFISVYFFLFIFPLAIGCAFSFKLHSSKKKDTNPEFTKSTLIWCFVITVGSSLFVELLFFSATHYG